MADWDLNTDTQWALDDVEPEAREAAKLAARKARMTIGGWLSQAILKAATDELKHRRNGAAGPAQSGGSDSAYGSGRTNGGGHGTLAPTHEVVLESIQRLAGRLEMAEQHTAETIRPLAEKVSLLSQRIEEVGSKGDVSTAPLERAMMRLTERLERLESELGGKEGGRRGLFSR